VITDLIGCIRSVIPRINELGRREGAVIKRCMIILYAVTNISNFKVKALSSGGSLYFTLHSLSEIARDRENILGQSIKFDKARHALNAYKKCENSGYAKFLPREDILKEGGVATTYISITNDGIEFCENVIQELLLTQKNNIETDDKSNDPNIVSGKAINTSNDTNITPSRLVYAPKVFKGEKTIFVGREKQIQELRRLMTKSESPISLVGEGGIWKTSLAFKSINSCPDTFDCIIDIYFESEPRLENFVSDMARRVPISADNFYKEDLQTRQQIILSTLASLKHPVILADNYEVVSESLDNNQNTEDARGISSFLESVPANTTLLLTSRYRNNLAGEYCFNVPGLSDEEGIGLFFQLAKKHFSKMPRNEITEVIRKICVEIGGHPLSIKLLAGSYRGGGITELQSMTKSILMRSTNDREGQGRMRSITNCFDYSFNKLSDKNKRLLLDLSMFKSPFLNLVIRQIFEHDSEERLVDLFNRSWIARIDFEDQFSSDRYRLYDFHKSIKLYLAEKPNAKDLLVETKLVNRYCEYFQGLSDYVHRLLDLGIHSKDDLFLLRAFNLMIKRKDNDFEQAINLTSDVRDKSFIANRLTLIMNLMGLNGASLYYASMSLNIDLAYKDLERIANDHTNIGITLNQIGEYDKAIQHFEKALGMRQQLKDRTNIARSYNYIGSAYAKIGDQDKALEYYRKSLEINKEIGDARGLSADYGNMGSAFFKKGCLKEALSYNNMALTLDEKANNIMEIARDYYNLGSIVSAMGDKQKALDFYESALQFDEKIDNMYGVMRDCKRLAKELDSMGDLNKAKKYYKRANTLELQIEIIDDRYQYYGTSNGRIN
jgi:tetratricopeptide (TPR) repeat protein